MKGVVAGPNVSCGMLDVSFHSVKVYWAGCRPDISDSRRASLYLVVMASIIIACSGGVHLLARAPKMQEITGSKSEHKSLSQVFEMLG